MGRRRSAMGATMQRIVLLGWLFLVPVYAQIQLEQRATIAVVDENGVPVPDARVLFTSVDGSVTLRCQTSTVGACTVPSSGSGPYRVRVEKETFYAAEASDLHFDLIPSVELTLVHQREVREVVEVVESQPAINPEQINAQEQISGVDVLNLPYPVTRDYRNVLNYIPQVVNDVYRQPHITGAETYQTLVLFDGSNATQPANGQLLLRVSTDAFRSINVQTSRISAQYGKGSGGVLELNTATGDDHFRVAVTDFIPSVQNRNGPVLDKVNPRITFSGPITKGRVWFFDAADAEYANIIEKQLPPDMDQVLGNDRVNTSPSLAVDTSHGSNAGNIYVVYSNNNNGDGADVYLQRSTNGGVSFSTPIILNKAPGSDRAQWFPWVTVDQDTGKVSVFYYDQGVATSGDRTQVSFVVSTDGGRTFTRQRPLTATPFHAGWGNTTGQPNLGDYNQAVAQDGQLYAVWAGTSQAGFADNQPNLTLNVPDVYFRKFPASGAIVPAEMDLAVATGMRKAPLISADPAAEPSVITNLVRENFDEPGLPPRALPPGWSSQHGAGANTVPWITRSFCGTTSKTAFHQNANDAPDPTSSPSRWERLFSPPFTVPADTSFVVVEFDICYNTEDDPNFNILAYDGVFLRVTDLTPGRTLRSVLAEAFEERFVTGAKEHYPKHFPRSNDPNYFEDMSAWAGFSHGFKHVRIKLPGMEGSTAQLRFEFTQDAFGTCKDVRPKHSCGVAIDNVRVNAVK